MANFGVILVLIGFILSIYFGVKDSSWLMLIVPILVMTIGGIFLQFNGIFNGWYRASHGGAEKLLGLRYVFSLLISSIVLWGIVSAIPFFIARLF